MAQPTRQAAALELPYPARIVVPSNSMRGVPIMIKLWRNWIEAGRFATDVQWVIGLRMLRLASGGPVAAAEAQRMVTEKVDALGAAQAAAGLALGAGMSLDQAIVRAAAPIKKRVRANRRRLGRGRA
jgi:hypothetical protein